MAIKAYSCSPINFASLRESCDFFGYSMPEMVRLAIRARLASRNSRGLGRKAAHRAALLQIAAEIKAL